MTEDRKTKTPDDPLIALGRQWQEAYDRWLQFSTDGDSTEKIVELENQREGLGNIAWRIEDQAAEIPAQSIDGALVHLRMAGTHYHLMERDGLNWHDKYAQLTWQAWDGLEHVTGRLAPEDPVLALKREWDGLCGRLVHRGPGGGRNVPCGERAPSIGGAFLVRANRLRGSWGGALRLRRCPAGETV